jgi:hypothetical protein
MSSIVGQLLGQGHPKSQLCTVCTNINTRPLSFAQMEEHINGRRHLHFLQKASLSYCTPSTRPAHRFRAHHAHASTPPRYTYWQEQSKSLSRTALAELECLLIIISQIRPLRSRASLWRSSLARAREQWRHHQYLSVFVPNKRRRRFPNGRCNTGIHSHGSCHGSLPNKSAPLTRAHHLPRSLVLLYPSHLVQL